MKSILKSALSVVTDIYNYFKPTSRVRTVRLIILIIVLAGSAFLVKPDATETGEIESVVPIVTVGRADALSAQSSFSVLGTVAAVSEANLKAEVSGRITSVPAKLGQSVTAGSVIATFENSAQYASVLQAEGVYEAALASAAQGVVSVASAENALASAKDSAATTYTNAYAKLNAAFYNTLDEIFADPERTYRTPGFVPKDFDQKEGLVDRSYRTLNKLLIAQRSVVFEKERSIELLEAAARDTDTLLELVDLLQRIIADNDIDEGIGTYENSYLSTLATVRLDLITVRTNLDTVRANILAAEKALDQAKLSGESGTASASDAQIKQALGALRAAQSNYAKTIVRSPISGVVNELSVKVGDFVSQQSRVALIANNDALEITAYVGERDRDRIVIGAEVLLENSETGIISAIAPAVDSVTKKFAVKIASESSNLKNGDTVSVLIKNDSNVHLDSLESPILVPITAVKFTHTDGVVFTVEDGILVENPVTLGTVRGAYIEVIEGITRQTEVVIDARGLSVGQTVEAIATK